MLIVKIWKPCEIEKCVALLLHKNWAMMVKYEFLKKNLFGPENSSEVLRLFWGNVHLAHRKNSRLNNHSVLKYKELRFCQIRSRIGLGKSHTVRIENSSIVEGSTAERSAFYLQLSAFNLPPSPHSWNHSQTTTSHYFAGVCTAPKVGFLRHQLGLWKRV